jgi:hypothetical protein
MKYLWSIILILIVSLTYSQDSTTVDTISGSTLIVFKKDNRLIYTNNPSNLIKVKPKFRVDNEKTRAGIIIRNTCYGGVAAGLSQWRWLTWVTLLVAVKCIWYEFIFYTRYKVLLSNEV